MSSQNKNKQVQCYICMQMMRSDNLQRHVDAKHVDATKLSVKEQAEINNNLYFQNIETGKHLYDLIVAGEVEEESLSREHLYAFGLYNKMRPILDVGTMELRPWQEHVVQLLEEPTSRQIIWIRGRSGNEGKSWLQLCIQSMFGR